ncbi:Hypothetical predicted protein [Octopus vulgaris]|uniref:Uncharacterized protein n=1 Tax=Octopus vulgaris TaxID=6645 RepID=A0AA36BA92_OCTVU|nr:Hypothetical predicted protein [Octopus vulgaris]
MTQAQELQPSHHACHIEDKNNNFHYTQFLFRLSHNSKEKNSPTQWTPTMHFQPATECTPLHCIAMKETSTIKKCNILTVFQPKITGMKIWKPALATFSTATDFLNAVLHLTCMSHELLYIDFLCIHIFLHFKCYFLAFQDQDIFYSSLSFSFCFCLHCTPSFVYT